MAELQRHYIKRPTAQARAYSQAVVTEGGRTIWLAGQVAVEDGGGRGQCDNAASIFNSEHSPRSIIGIKRLAPADVSYFDKPFLVVITVAHGPADIVFDLGY